MDEVIHDEASGRFILEEDGVKAHVQYRIYDGCLDIRHTTVPSQIEGRGIASLLVKTAYDYAAAHSLRPVATCSYAVKWLSRHPECGGTTGQDYCKDGTCAL